VKILIAFSTFQTIAIIVLAYMLMHGPAERTAEAGHLDYEPADVARETFSRPLDESDVRRIVRAELARFQYTNSEASVGSRASENGVPQTEVDSTMVQEAVQEANQILAEFINNGSMTMREMDALKLTAAKLPLDERHRLFEKIADALEDRTINVQR
jgi:hypothetical protein